MKALVLALLLAAPVLAGCDKGAIPPPPGRAARGPGTARSGAA
jgi:hypothetical protein